MTRVGASAVVLALCVAGCSASPALPPGIVCSSTARATPETVQARLGEAASGSCVALAAGVYAAFLVPAGVKVVAELDAVVSVQTEAEAQAAVVLSEGSELHDVVVLSTHGDGVRIEGGKALVSGVHVRGAGRYAIIAWTEEDTRPPEDWVELLDVEAEECGIGVWVHHRAVSVQGGRIASSKARTPSLGHGVVATGGARLRMEGTVVEGNAGIGLLLDGATTRAELAGVALRTNDGAGLWGQGLRGTLDTPALTLASCQVEGNRMAGLGLRDALGVKVEGGRIAGTRMLAVLTDEGQQALVGDGLGVFLGAGLARLQDVVLEGNERSQVLVDQGREVTLVGGQISATGTQRAVVVQRTTEPVSAPVGIEWRAAGDELPLSAPQVSLP